MLSSHRLYFEAIGWFIVLTLCTRVFVYYILSWERSEGLILWPSWLSLQGLVKQVGARYSVGYGCLIVVIGITGLSNKNCIVTIVWFYL